VVVTFSSVPNQNAQISMNGAENNANVSTPNLASTAQSVSAARRAVEPGARAALLAHWPEYVMEAGLLGAFMVSACAFGVLLGFPRSPVVRAVPTAFLRQMLGGLAMGLTALSIFYSPWGKQSGAHINPSVTLTFFRLRKVNRWDAVFYIASQFTGAVLGVSLAALALRSQLSHPAVRFVVTVPGMRGLAAAFIAEFAIALGMMTAVLHFSNHPRLAPYTGMFASLLVAAYITLESPFSGMSMNPARSFGSAFVAGIWDHFWIYLTAPLLGMLSAAEIFLWQRGPQALGCCKIQHNTKRRCIFCGANGGFSQ
jgi:aquaporin Z